MKEIVCGLDIGSSKLSAVVAKGTRERLEPLGAETLPVRGIDKGAVEDLASFVDCIATILEKVSLKTKTKIKSVLVSVNGDCIVARSSFAAVAFSERTNRHVTATDINYLRRQARLLGLRIDELILHEFPQDYVLDDGHATASPLGLLARKVRLNSYLFSASYPFLGNINSAINQAGYGVAATVFSGIASSLSVLSIEEKKRGVILLDMGASFTTMLFFKDGVVRDYSIICFGGNDITKSIASGLELPGELAEEVKKSSLILSSADSLPSGSLVIRRGGSYTTVEKIKLYESAKQKVEQFIDSIHEALKRSNWAASAECGIVGIGGTARLEGLLEKIELRTAQPVRFGNIKTHTLLGDSLDVQCAAAVGLLYYWFESKKNVHLRNSFIGRNYLERSANFVQHLFQEYF